MAPPSSASAPSWRAYLWLAASMAMVGSYVGLTRDLVAVFPVLLLAWMRFALAALAMASWLRPASSEPVLSPAAHKLLFLQSLFGNVLFTWCALTGTWLTSSLSAGVVLAGIPAAVAILSRVFLGERIHSRMMVSIALTVAGICLLAWARSAPTTHTPASWDVSVAWGWLLLVAACFCEAAYVVIGKRLSATVSPKRVTAIINLWGLVLSTPLGLMAAISFPFHTVGTGSWVLLLYYALAASVLTVWMWMRGLQSVPAQQAGIFTVCLPLSAAAIGVVWQGETWSLWHGAALILASSAVILATWRPSDH